MSTESGLRFAEPSESMFSRDEKSGCRVTIVTGFILLLLAVVIAVGVGIIVHFASPRGPLICVPPTEKTTTSDPGRIWQDCLDLSLGKNACLSAPYCWGGAYTDSTTEHPTTISGVRVSDVRLPLNVIPLHYDLELQPDFYGADKEQFTFNGSVQISLECKAVTRQVVLHIKALTLEGGSMVFEGPAGAPALVNWEEDKERQFLKVNLDGELKVGQNYLLRMRFRGPLTGDLVGLYYSSYKTSSNETRYLATTQMQPTDARKTFPCFDEPGVKATFTTTLLRRSGYISLSNMDVARTESRAGGWEADVYDKTLKMSTYLLAFVVCDFNKTEKYTPTSHIKFRIWSRPEAVEQTRYALDIGVQMLEKFESYFGIGFPLPKQDMIAVPDFAAGAMENWGLIIYRETALLFDPEVSSATNQQRVAEVVSHELAHQWFGNLVTPVWWDDLWLNEGFASFVEYLGMDDVHPTWKMFDQFVSKDLQNVLTIDSLSSSHPIYVPVNHPDEINEIFDRISYLKGASIIRMMDFFLTTSTFQNGLKLYLERYKYGSANHTNLWNALADNARLENKPIDVAAIMDTWVRQMGYPVVTFTRDPIRREMAQITQEQFLIDPTEKPSDKYPSPFNYMWTLPLTYAESTSPASAWDRTSIHVSWVTKEQRSVKVYDLDANSLWVIGNVGQYGYYRVNYDANNWEALLNQLKADHSVIPDKNRAQIIDDSFQLAKAGRLPLTTALRTTQYLSQETEYVPWMAAVENLAYLDLMLGQSAAYGMYAEYMLSLVTPHYNRLAAGGWDYNVTTEEHLDKYMRAHIFSKACTYGLPECRQEGLQLYSNWMNDPENVTIIKPDLRSLVYCNGIAEGGVTEWDFAFRRYGEANVASEGVRLLGALACTRLPWLLSRYLSYTLDETKIRKQDAISVIVHVSRNPIGRYMAWDFVRDKWDQIMDMFGGGFFLIGNLITGLTRSFNTQFQIQQLEWFNEAHPDLGAGSRAFTQAAEKAKANVRWMQTNELPIMHWLANVTASP